MDIATCDSYRLIIHVIWTNMSRHYILSKFIVFLNGWYLVWFAFYTEIYWIPAKLPWTYFVEINNFCKMYWLFHMFRLCGKQTFVQFIDRRSVLIYLMIFLLMLSSNYVLYQYKTSYKCILNIIGINGRYHMVWPEE